MDAMKQDLIKAEYTPVRSSAEDESDWSERSFGPPRSTSSKTRSICVHVGIALTYTVTLTLGILYFWRNNQQQGPSLIYTPAREAMQYKIEAPYNLLPDKYHEDPFFGDPSPELDERWTKRLEFATIRITKEEFQHYDQDGILLSDDSGYLATPTVYHDLHCLRALHKSIYPEYYYPGEDISYSTEHGKHWRHCLHNLALSAMCGADMTMRVMRWHPNLELPSPVDHEHECVDWDAIEAWAGARVVNMSTPGLVVHP